MKQKNQVRFGLRLKLFLFVLLSFTFLMAMIVWRIDRQSELVANETIQRTLQQSEIIINTSQQNRFNTIRETAISLSRDGRILPRVFEQDSASLQDLSGEFKAALQFDMVMFINQQGRILARSDKPSMIGQPLQGRSHLIDKALAGNLSHGYMFSQGYLLQIVAAPIFDNVLPDVVRGVVSIAYRLTQEQAGAIQQLTDSEIGFLAFTKEKGNQHKKLNTLFFTNPKLLNEISKALLENPDLWQVGIKENQGAAKIELQLMGEHYHGLLYPLARSGGGVLGMVMVLQSRTRLLHPFKVIQQQVLLAGGVFLIIASLVAWLIAYSITQPINALVLVAKRIQDSDYPEPEAKFSNKRDETGVLYKAIIKMGNTLRDKAELETYLAQVTESLVDDSQNESDIKDFFHPVALEDATRVDDTLKLYQEQDLSKQVANDKIVSDRPVMNSLTLQPGQLFAERYRLIRFLGQGTMGKVLLVNDLDLGEHLALKVFVRQGLDGEELDRFKEEIRLARLITHRNILRTYDFGVWQNYYYISMEYIHGYDLANLIHSRGKLTSHIALIMGKQICSAIIAAHDQGIIHRDLKPANIMINQQGILKLMDFGLAMRLNTGYDESANGFNNSEESIKHVAGTPRYMAPEQFNAEELDERTDIYAIGGILYFILSQRPPFLGESYQQLAVQHMSEMPENLLQLNPDIPQELNVVVMKALSKQKSQRYQNVIELLNALSLIKS